MALQYLTQTIQSGTLAIRFTTEWFLVGEVEYYFLYNHEAKTVNLRVRHLAAEHFTMVPVAKRIPMDQLTTISEQFWNALQRRCATIDLSHINRHATDDLPELI